MASGQREDDFDYLRAVEALAREVVEEAADEGWLAYGEEGRRAKAPLQRAINDLASRLRMTHYDGDGCLDHSRVDPST